jgi:riboflavin kinase / FMN adenylyltransferase
MNGPTNQVRRMPEWTGSESMAVVTGVDALRPSDGPLFIVVGVFDGIHLGHRYLLRHLRRLAARRNARPAIVTFDHHPDEILVGAAPPLLSDPQDRLRLLAAAGVGVTIVQHFDEALRLTPYDAFVDRIARRTELAGFLMTPDTAFGHEREGTPAALSVLGAELGFEVEIVAPFTLEGGPVRSTDIRAAIAAGDLAMAERLLGRPVAVVGEASEGPAGSTVRFALPVALPPDGPYRVHVAAPARRPVATTAVVADGSLVVASAATGRTRVTFAGLATPRAAR